MNRTQIVQVLTRPLFAGAVRLVTPLHVYGKDRIPAVIDRNDPVVKYGLDHHVK